MKTAEKGRGNMRRVKAGWVGFGEVNTPRDLIEQKCKNAEKLLEISGLELIATAPVSDDPAGVDVNRAIDELKREEFDVLILCIAGWIPSHAVIRIAAEFAHIPMVLWGLAGHYEEDRLITTADQAGTTALRKVMEDMGYTFKYIFDFPGKTPSSGRVADFARAAGAAAWLRNARIGMMGYRDMNLYGTMFDGVSLRGRLGVEIEFFEMLEIDRRLKRLIPGEIAEVVEGIKRDWQFEIPAREETLTTGAGYYLALRDKILERGYVGVSLIDVDGMKKLAGFPPSMVFMLLADKLGVCTTPENDSLGTVTQLIVKYLTGQIAAYMEFYEFMEDRVLIGVPDYVPSEIVEGPVKVYPTAFGNFSDGVLNVSKVKVGKVTMARLTHKGDRYAMHLVTGEAVTPRKWEEAGWRPPAPQLPGLEVILDVPVEEFAQKVMSQHYIISYGDNTGILREFCRLKGIEVV